MSEINFSSLPWFIRRDIIDRVVHVNSNYCLVGSEWLHSRSRQFSEIHFGYRPVNKVRPKSLLTKYSETIGFSRTGHINWRKVYERDRIQKVIISSLNKEYGELDFIEKLFKLQNLKHLIFRGYVDDFEVARVLRYYSNALKALRICQIKIDCSPYIQGITFASLISLQLFVKIDFFSSINITEYMPNLKRLDLCFYDIETCKLLPDDVIIPSISQLSLEHTYAYDSQIELDISRFPNIKSLRLLGEFKVLDTKPCLNLRDVNLIGLKTALTDIQLPTFYNIRRLRISITDLEDYIVKLTEIMKIHPTLSYFHLQIYHEESITNFPVSSFKVNTLQIQGHIPIYLYLNWIFSSFSIERLDLDVHTNPPSETEPTPSENLKHVVVRTLDPILIEWYKSYFCKKFYPQLELLEFLPAPERYELEERLWAYEI